MSDNLPTQIEVEITPKQLKRGFGLSLLFGILLIVLGIVAIARPLFAGIATDIYLGWVLVFGGLTQVIYAIQTRTDGQLLWKILTGIVYSAAGLILILYPQEGLLTLALVVGVSILSRGLIQVLLGVRLRPEIGWGWLLARGILVTGLGAWILADWPGDAPWLIGTLVGFGLISDGAGITALSVFARDVIDTSQSTATG